AGLVETEPISNWVRAILLRARCWREVIQLHDAGRFGITNALLLLDLALAHWGEDGEMPISVCSQALERSMQSDEHSLDLLGGAGSLQAGALLFWRVGQTADAIDLLEKAEQGA